MSLGFGAMIYYLSGGSEHDPSEFYGKKILSVEMTEERLSLKLEDQTIHIFDDGQSCCEHRHMTTDDDVQSLVGHTLQRIEAKEAPDIEDEFGDYEQVFVEIGTDIGFITIVNHNEHNGYYGGFGLTIKVNDE